MSDTKYLLIGMSTLDNLSRSILDRLEESKEPLSTKEIVEKLSDFQPKASREMILSRLRDLRGDGKIYGKKIESAGRAGIIWIWWKSGILK